MNKILERAMAQASRFDLPAPIVSITPFGSGHINDTFLVVTQQGNWVLQRIGSVFPYPEKVMANMAGVIHHMKARPGNRFPGLLTTPEGAEYVLDDQNRCWRMQDHMPDTVSYDLPDGPEVFRQAALAFGEFQLALADYPAETLHETLPHFHDTPERVKQLEAAVEGNAAGRLEACREEIAFALARREKAAKLMTLLGEGKLPLRVTHNDTKLNNVLMDRQGRAVCVVDLDTVMPGLCAWDFGDAIRFGANTALEDEKDLSKVHFSLEMFRAYADGYLAKTAAVLTDLEKATLPLGAWMMTYECGIRFLADYLNGDTYFKVAYPEHNIVRARNQFKLLEDMENNEEAMAQIINSLAGGLE